MSGGSTFSDVTLLVPETKPVDAVVAFLRIKRQAKAEGWTREQTRDVLEMANLIPYTSHERVCVR